MLVSINVVNKHQTNLDHGYTHQFAETIVNNEGMRWLKNYLDVDKIEFTNIYLYKDKIQFIKTYLVYDKM